MTADPERAKRSTDWLIENYGHIVESDDLSIEEKAAFLSACCHPTRCYLMQLDLRQRIDLIFEALAQHFHKDSCRSDDPDCRGGCW